MTRHQGRVTKPANKGLVTVAYLHPGHLAACFARSLTELLFYDAAHKARIVSHPYGDVPKQCGSAGIVSGRNHVTRIFADESAAEWLFMVDSDMGFAPDTVEKLIESADPKTRPVIGALCFAQKADGRKSHGGIRYRAQPTLYDYAELSDRVGFIARTDYTRNSVELVGATGAACLLIHRSAVERVAEKYGQEWWEPITHPKGPTTFSEDMSFCLRLAACDIPVYVDTSVKTTHDKGGVFLDEEFYDWQESTNPTPVA